MVACGSSVKRRATDLEFMPDGNLEIVMVREKLIQKSLAVVLRIRVCSAPSHGMLLLKI